MFPKGIIYEAGKSSQTGEFLLRPKFLARAFYHIVRAVGGGLIGFAVIALSFSYYPVIRDEVTYQFKSPAKAGFGDLLETSATDFGMDPYFSLYVPKINAKATVIPNVNPGSYNDYSKALKKGVAHAAGTNFPGQNKLIYLFSHSTNNALNFSRYNAIFFLLRKVEKGDRIMVFFLGKEYEYVVTQKLVVGADDNSWLRDKNEGEYLVLQTCDPPGTSLRRLIVVAKPI